MSQNETPATEENNAAFSLQKLYVKDLSFENPNAPEMYTKLSAQPEIEMNLNQENRQIDADHWEVSLKISVLARESQSKKVLFEIEIEHAGVFFLKGIPEEHMEMLLAIDCPTIILPYVRQQISQMTVDGGYMPLLLEPVNFAAIYENNKKQQTH